MIEPHSVAYPAGDSLIDVPDGWASQLVSTHGLARAFVSFARAGSRIRPADGQRYNGLAIQIDRIIADVDSRGRPASAVAIILTGGNDLKDVRSPSQFAPLVKEVAVQTDRLIAAGIARVLWMRLPVAYCPQILARKDWALVKAGIDQFNNTMADELLKRPQVRAISLDRLFADIYADPRRYGFSRFDDAFKDGFHHSAKTQPVIARFVAEEYGVIPKEPPQAPAPKPQPAPTPAPVKKPSALLRFLRALFARRR